MSKARYEPQNDDYVKDVYFFYEIFNQFSADKKALVHFLRDFFTKSELRMFRRRWHISCLLDQGYDTRTVATAAKSSTMTVTTVKKMIVDGIGGWVNALMVTREGRAEDVGEISRNARKSLPPFMLDYRREAKPMDSEKFKRWVFASGGPSKKK